MYSYRKSSKSMKRVKIPYGEKHFFVNLEFSERKTISITVFPDKTIRAKAPSNSNDRIIMNSLKKKRFWIAKQLKYFENFQPLLPEKKYVSGETYYYLGREIRLRTRKSKTERVKNIGKFLYVDSKDYRNSESVKNLLEEWYELHALNYLTKRFYLLRSDSSEFRNIDVTLQLKKLNKRWGSCSNKKSVSLNIELIKVPIKCIDYVIVHELCHLVYMNHSREYYQLLSKVIPDWEIRKEKLNSFTI